MFPDLDTVCVVKRMDHRAAVASAADARLAVEVSSPAGIGPAAAVATRTRLARTLAAIRGRRRAQAFGTGIVPAAPPAL